MGAYYFRRANSEEIRRKYKKGERKNSNQTLPKLACQVFEKELTALLAEERENKGDRKLVMYCWNIFSTIIFVQECLKRFGEQGDQFILIYREKEAKTSKVAPKVQEEAVQQVQGYKNPYSSMLIESKNVIFRGAPGTGKSYLAKKIAADMISKGKFDDYMLLNDEKKRQIEFVQFHPSYDYTDFVEGLRPKVNDDGTMGFELQDEIFKKFVTRARKNYEELKPYIIGTMNDIDRSVDSFDFAMRRRFRLVELKANEHLEMLASLEEPEESGKRRNRLKSGGFSIAEKNISGYNCLVQSQPQPP